MTSGSTGYAAAIRRLPIAQRLLLVLLGVAVVLANVRQPYPQVAPLQHIPTVLLILAAPPLLARWPLSTGSVAAVVGFMLLHTLAGRYTYSNVPYDLWSRTVTGVNVNAMFGATRNGFDRLVHLAFGLCWTGPIAAIHRRHGGLRRAMAMWTAVLFIGAFSAVYEIFEWLLTLTVPPELAADYNGQQGDPWDSQKDMACAIAGSTCVALASMIAVRRDRLPR